MIYFLLSTLLSLINEYSTNHYKFLLDVLFTVHYDTPRHHTPCHSHFLLVPRRNAPLMLSPGCSRSGHESMYISATCYPETCNSSQQLVCFGTINRSGRPQHEGVPPCPTRTCDTRVTNRQLQFLQAHCKIPTGARYWRLFRIMLLLRASFLEERT